MPRPSIWIQIFEMADAIYSVRNARIGFTRVARRAGSHVAPSAATASNNGAAVKAIGSSGPTS
jgi:hypothetical protein